MPLPILAIAAAVTAAAGLAKSYIGARQANKAAKMAANNTRPDFDIADEYYTNQSLAQNAAQSGLGAQSLDYYTNQANRGLTSTNDALLQSGGGPNAIANSYDRYQQGIGSIAAANAQAQRQNINALMDRNSQLAEQKTMKWSLDKYEPYKDTARTASALQAQGTQNIFNGLSQAGSAAASYAQSGYYKDSNAGAFGYANPQNNPDTAIQNVRPSATVAAPTFNYNNGTDTNDANSYIDDGLQGMENSPYRDLIRQRLQDQYYQGTGGVNPANVG
jgi:hypothetical protein